MPPKNRRNQKGTAVPKVVAQPEPASQETGVADAPVTAIGEKRPGVGSAGKKENNDVNMFELTLKCDTIYHYDADMVNDKPLPVRRGLELFARLQEASPNIFTQKVVFDGKKNMYSSYRLGIPDDSKEFEIIVSSGNDTRPARIRIVKIKLVNKINPESLLRFTQGKQSFDEEAQTTLQALNVALRMEPMQNLPFNTRSFFTPDGKKVLPGGLELWRGYFQSVRPVIDKLVANVDISTAIMYQEGTLINLCLKHLNLPPNNASALANLDTRQWYSLKRFLTGLKVTTGGQTAQRPPRAITGLLREGASKTMFNLRRDGEPDTTISVAEYFKKLGRPLRYPGLPCVEVSSGKTLLPLEVCDVPEGQFWRGQIAPELTAEMVKFSTLNPTARFNAIQRGREVLGYDRSEWLQQFGITIGKTPIQVESRTLAAPTMQYGIKPGPRPQAETLASTNSFTPTEGAWNVKGKRFFKPMPLDSWAVLVVEDKSRFPLDALKSLVIGLKKEAANCGMLPVKDPVLSEHVAPQQSITKRLEERPARLRANKLPLPQIVFFVLPFNGDERWTEVKYWGDIVSGVATQCLKAQKSARANSQYWANVCMKINAKLGGINAIIRPGDPSNLLADRNQPTLVLGADVIHPSPGSVGQLSYAAMVGSVDPDAAKYRATSREQASRQELIEDFEDMAKELIQAYMDARKQEGKTAAASKPARIFVYRDGVSEGQFKQVKDEELPKLRAACRSLQVTPKITFVIATKRHNTRLNPLGNKDRSGNAPAGSVIDTNIVDPVEFDFYLQSHAGIQGTSRPVHYWVLRDENQLNADALQCFTYNLCHVYARATRSVSIPAPTYYADIVCARAKTHYKYRNDHSVPSEATSSSAGQSTAAGEQASFQQVHPRQKGRMYYQ
ncbi:Piwi-domain-containing protein [Schizophyllum commune Tattone D]|nr:Piwi-domain-containing protein [Schizophyllum commune Tattone D]